MQIREGAYYVTRNGYTVGPATPNPDSSYYPWNVPLNGRYFGYNDDGTTCIAARDWDIVAEAPGSVEASDSPTLWRDMTPEQKGALLLAHHEGKVIENSLDGITWIAAKPYWADNYAYRVRPEPKRETERVTIVNADGMVIGCGTVITENGKPDCASIRMEEIQ